ncbi:MAG: HlyD family efflux transporter periplasmic adaptor subunit [Cyclobacteriaceae bacterium]
MSEEYDDIEIRSEEVQEILSQPPAWLIRWGITLVFGIVLTIVFLSWIMEYPDVVPAQVVLTTENPPNHMIAKSSGKVDLLVDDQEEVKEGSILAVITNPAKTKDVLALDSSLKLIYQNLYSENFDPFKIKLETNYDLGAVQPDFSVFYRSVQNATREKKFVADTQAINSAREDLLEAQRQTMSIQRNLETKKEELEIARRLYEKEKAVFAFGGSDSIQLLNRELSKLNAISAYESLQSQLLRNGTDIKRAENNLRALQLNLLDNSSVLKNAVKEAYEALEYSIFRWKDQFILESPFDGTVSLSKFWYDDQFIQSGEELLVVIPKNEDIIGRLALPIAGSGKVKLGQKVNIKLENYPYNDFGILVGRIESISSVARDGLYNVQITIPQNMKSSYNKEIPFRQEMIGQADIITEDKKLFHRIFNQLREILNRAV